MIAVVSVCIKKNLSKLVNFCAAFLILKMEENKQHFSILLFIISKKVRTQKKICAVCEKVLWLIKCVKSHLKFCSGGFLLDNVPRSGRPVEVDTDQITTLNENNQCYTTWEMANILKIPKSIKLLVKMKKIVFYEKTIWTFWPAQYSVGSLVSSCQSCENGSL